MSTTLRIPNDYPRTSLLRGLRIKLRGSQSYLNSVDLLMVLAAASLPWSTTLPAVFISLWLLAALPAIDGDELFSSIRQPAFYLPLALFAVAILAMSWSVGTWPERLHALKPVGKLLLIPFLLDHFRRSRHCSWVFFAFLGSCVLMMILSWVVLVAPQFKIRPTVSAGVPVKNYIDQSQEFAACAFALALPALVAYRTAHRALATACLLLIAAFISNLLFVASARTALIYMPTLTVLFAVRYLDKRATVILFAGLLLAGLIVWTCSPYLRNRIDDIGLEYRHGNENPALASTAQRLIYWEKSLNFIDEAPLFGHGTGSVKRLFEHDAIGRTGLWAEVVSNPHNQTLNVAVQWGFFGVALLYTMWLSHVRLFAGRGFAAWTGLVVVAQNIVSSLLNSHLFDFHEGWIYVLGVGVAGGAWLRKSRGGTALHLALDWQQPTPGVRNH